MKRVAPPRTKRAEHQARVAEAKQKDRGRSQTGRPSRPQTDAQRHSQLKKQERLHRRRSRSVRRTVFVLFVVGLIALIVYGALSAINAPWFYASDIKISGLGALTDQTVVEQLAIDPTESLILLSKTDLETKLLRHPWIKEVEIRKRLPHTVTITVKERVPTARVRISPDEMWLVSSDSRWLGRVEAKESLVHDPESLLDPVTYDTGDLITIIDLLAIEPDLGKVIASPDLKNAIGIIIGISDGLRDQVKTISALDIAKTKMMTKSGVEIAVGSVEDIDIKDRIIRSILAEQKGKVVLINVRTIDKPTWRGLTQ